MVNFFDFLFPKRCVTCGKVGEYFCESCRKKIKFSPFQICPVCQKPSITGQTHPKCLTKYSINGQISVFEFLGAIKEAIKKLKYKWQSDLADELVFLLLENLWKEKTLPPDKFTLIPVPLSKKRLNWRGFNQSALLGKILAEKLDLEFREDLLFKTKDTIPQVSLSGKERRKNLDGAFKAGQKDNIFGKTFLLIDDVASTGSTLRNCASVLKRRGAQKVWGLTVAK